MGIVAGSMETTDCIDEVKEMWFAISLLNVFWIGKNMEDGWVNA